MLFAIDKGIPVPNGEGKSKYPFADMAVGDSFLVPFVAGKSHEYTDKRLRSSAAIAQRRYEAKFVVRVVDGGVRCWRVA